MEGCSQRATAVKRAESASYTSPGRSPGSAAPRGWSAEGAIYPRHQSYRYQASVASRESIGRAYSASHPSQLAMLRFRAGDGFCSPIGLRQMMNGSVSPHVIPQAPLPVWAVHQYTVISERLSPELRSKVKPHTLAFANRMKLPGVWVVALQKLASNEIKLAFPEASEQQQIVILFLAVMQTLQAGPAASGLRFDPNAAGKAELKELADQRAKALEVLETVMQTVRDVDKTVLDSLQG